MSYTKVSEKEILNWLKENLSPERFSHTLGTAKKAEELANKYSLDSQKAYIAGLLHDCAKCFSNEKLLEIIKKNLNIEECEMMNYKTLHAPVSAYIAQTQFGVEDNEILSAIRWHTLGKIEMTDFEKIIFLADKIEPNTREKEYTEKISGLLNEDNGLNKALLKCYKETIKSLVKRNLKICPLTIDIYNRLQELVN
ncbi:MAG: bis(5'-nucleosyl)-tetraphosphatase (symmetrical) YqeK [Clostridiaceae bacterium]|jgi:nicotinate-nucleotide adenylyltransferase|nr:bis(5'-nucleosyl)-tetraphosphatase (symmetrical) YqeK [Clostridiaceae bacterium]